MTQVELDAWRRSLRVEVLHPDTIDTYVADVGRYLEWCDVWRSSPWFASNRRDEERLAKFLAALDRDGNYTAESVQLAESAIGRFLRWRG